MAAKAAITAGNSSRSSKRENGSDVGIIKPGEAVSIAATPTLSNVLTGKTAGLTVTQGAGSPGSSSRIRIRGSNSVSLSNEPLLIIDGVRVNNDVQASSLGVGGQVTSRFDDINPEDIESIEVLKGPAASALYGTAAANGVSFVADLPKFVKNLDVRTAPPGATDASTTTGGANGTGTINISGINVPAGAFVDIVFDIDVLDAAAFSAAGGRDGSGINAG